MNEYVGTSKAYANKMWVWIGDEKWMDFFIVLRNRRFCV